MLGDPEEKNLVARPDYNRAFRAVDDYFSVEIIKIRLRSMSPKDRQVVRALADNLTPEDVNSGDDRRALDRAIAMGSAAGLLIAGELFDHEVDQSSTMEAVSVGYYTLDFEGGKKIAEFEAKDMRVVMHNALAQRADEFLGVMGREPINVAKSWAKQSVEQAIFWDEFSYGLALFVRGAVSRAQLLRARQSK